MRKSGVGLLLELGRALNWTRLLTGFLICALVDGPRRLGRTTWLLLLAVLLTYPLALRAFAKKPPGPPPVPRALATLAARPPAEPARAAASR